MKSPLFFFMFFFFFSYSQENYLSKNLKLNNGQSIEFNFKESVIDKDGFFWISTESGLYKYDGATINKVYFSKYPNISNNRIKQLGLDYLTGDVVFSTYPDNFIYKVKDNVIQKLNLNHKNISYFFSEYNKCLLPNSSFNKFILNYLNYKKKMIPSEDVYQTSIVKLKKRYFVILNKRLFLFDFKKTPKEILLPNSKRLQLINVGNKVLLIYYGIKYANVFECITRSNNLKLKPFKFDTIFNSYLNKIANLRSNRNLEKHIIYDFKNYFLNFNGQIYKLKIENNKLVTEVKLSNKNDYKYLLYSLNESDSFLKHIYSKEVCFQYSNFFNVILFDDPEKNNCYSVASANEDLWVSTSNWIYSLKKNEKKEIIKEYIHKAFIFPYKKRLYYCGEDNELFDVITNQKLKYYKRLNKYSLQGYTFLENKLWFCDYRSLIYEKNNSFFIDDFILKKIKNIDFNKIHSYNGKLIILTSKGVYLYTPFKKVVKIKGLENVYARFFKRIDKNRFWIGTYGKGLFLVKNGKAFKTNFLNIEVNSVNAIEEDSEGYLWISSDNGLLNIKKSNALKKIITYNPIDCYKFTIDDGLPTNEFNGGGTHPSLKTKEGIIGFTSSQGFVWFNPRNVKKHVFSGNIVIESAEDEAGTIIEPKKDMYIINSDNKIINFKFSFPYYFSRKNITKEFRFTGEKKWHNINDYSFQIARDNNGFKEIQIRIHTDGFDSKTDVVKKIGLYYEPKFSETYWFWIIILLGLIILFYIAFQVGLKIYKKREIILKNKVEEKTNELLNANIELSKSKDELIKSLYEKDLLLKEIHHRVKNNLQLVISLLNIQGRKNNYTSIEEFLEKGQTRIMAMVLIHENLYQNDSIERLDVSNYLNSLVKSILDAFNINDSEITVQIKSNDITLNLQTAIPFGLMINEFVTNSIKYAFPTQTGKIKIELNQKGDEEFELILEDDGQGFDVEKISNKSFGVQLIKLLTNQLNGNIKMQTEKGTLFEITFKESFI